MAVLTGVVYNIANLVIRLVGVLPVDVVDRLVKLNTVVISVFIFC